MDKRQGYWVIVVKITRKCGICGEEINLVLDILDLVYDEKTKRFLHAKCEKERLLRRKRGRMPSDEVDSLVEKMLSLIHISACSDGYSFGHSIPHPPKDRAGPQRPCRLYFVLP